jgi:hypothetical protein
MRRTGLSVRTRRWLLVLAALLILGGLAVGLTPVPGVYDSEGLHCGSPFFYDNSEGYRGTDGFADCNRTRESRLPLSLGAVGPGLAVAAVASMGRKDRGARPAAFGRFDQCLVTVTIAATCPATMTR